MCSRVGSDILDGGITRHLKPQQQSPVEKKRYHPRSQPAPATMLSHTAACEEWREVPERTAAYHTGRDGADSHAVAGPAAVSSPVLRAGEYTAGAAATAEVEAVELREEATAPAPAYGTYFGPGAVSRAPYGGGAESKEAAGGAHIMVMSPRHQPPNVELPADNTLASLTAGSCGTEVEKGKPPSTVSVTLPAPLPSASGGEDLSASSFSYSLPRCSAVRALLAMRMHQEQQLLQSSCPPHVQHQRKHQLRKCHATCEPHLQASQTVLQQADTQQDQGIHQCQQLENGSHSSNSNSEDMGDQSSRPHSRYGSKQACGVGDDCSKEKATSLERHHVQTTHGRRVELDGDPMQSSHGRVEWDRDAVDDPILADFSSLEDEAFPYPLPCCSFLDLLPPEQTQPLLATGAQGSTQKDPLSHVAVQPAKEDLERHRDKRQVFHHQKRQPQPVIEKATGLQQVEGGPPLQQLQKGRERLAAEESYAQSWVEKKQRRPPRQQLTHTQQDDTTQLATQSNTATAALNRKRSLYFTPAYMTDTDVYTQLLERHFGKQKDCTSQAPGGGEEVLLPAVLGSEYSNFKPPPAFWTTELRPQAFRDRVSAIGKDIESLCIPPPPRRCPLRFMKFISHAQRLRNALTGTHLRPVSGDIARDIEASPIIPATSNCLDAAANAGTASLATSEGGGNSAAAGPAIQLNARPSSAAHAIAPDMTVLAILDSTPALEGGQSSCGTAVAACASSPAIDGHVATADRAEDEASERAKRLGGGAAADVETVESGVACLTVAVTAENAGSSVGATRRYSIDADNGGTASPADKPCDQPESASAGVCQPLSRKGHDCSAEVVSTAGAYIKDGGPFSASALRAVADYFGFFAVSGLRAPSLEEAVAWCVAEELRGWPEFLDATTMKVLKDVLAHSKARRFNRYPCRLAWPPISPLCTYSEGNLRCSMRELVNLKTYSLVQDYYRTRFHRQTSIHNIAVDQHGIEQRKLAAAEARYLRETKQMDKMSQCKVKQRHTAAGNTRLLQDETLLQRRLDRSPQEKHDEHSQRPIDKPLRCSQLPCGGRNRLGEEQDSANRTAIAAGEQNEYSDLHVSFSAPDFIYDRCSANRASLGSACDFFRRVSHDEAIVSVAFYHAARGTKLAAFDVLSTQTLLDVRTAFLGCCEAESEPGIPFFPGSCFLIDGILYPDTSHASSGPEYAEAIAEHLRSSGKLAKKRRISTVATRAIESITDTPAAYHKSAGGLELRVVRPRLRLDGSVTVPRPALPPRRPTYFGTSHKKQQQDHRPTSNASCPAAVLSSETKENRSNEENSREARACRVWGPAEKSEVAIAGSTGGAWDIQSSPSRSSSYTATDDARGDELEEDDEGNDWIMIPQHKAILNDMQLPLRSLECFVHQGTCEHRVIFWNVRQFDPKRDCCYVAAYPVRTYKPSSKAVTCHACDEHLACMGVLNSILCSVHNPTYLCEDCYSVLFGGAAERKLKKPAYATLSRYHSSGRAALEALFNHRDSSVGGVDVEDNTGAERDAIEQEEDDDPDPFALHFELYDG